MKKCWHVLALAALIPACAHHPKPATAIYQDPYTTYHLAYDLPLVSAGTKFALLPPAVQHTVRAEAGAAQISDIVKDTSAGRIVYRIYFFNSDAFPPLFIAPDGSVLNPNLTVSVGAPQELAEVVTGGKATGLTLGDLPPKVVKGIQQQAPDAEIRSITKERSGDNVTYLVTFKDQAHRPLRISSEGVPTR